MDDLRHLVDNEAADFKKAFYQESEKDTSEALVFNNNFSSRPFLIRSKVYPRHIGKRISHSRYIRHYKGHILYHLKVGRKNFRLVGRKASMAMAPLGCMFCLNRVLIPKDKVGGCPLFGKGIRIAASNHPICKERFNKGMIQNLNLYCGFSADIILEILSTNFSAVLIASFASLIEQGMSGS